MRGKVSGHSPELSLTRITPAYAGKSIYDGYVMGTGKDHPRICGEKEATEWNKSEIWGSPPHMRGKAYKVRLWMVCRKDHPRICGEKVRTGRGFTSSRGSPPHMRGKGMTSWGGILKTRITPAYAGKRSSFCVALLLALDHPRICGEK